MDFFFCIPVIFGCKTTLTPDDQQTQRMCPRCNNAAVISAKRKKWFELCFVPLVPMGSKHVWTCTICQWSVYVQPGGWEPAPLGQAGPPPAGYHPPGWQQAHYPPNQYQPQYQPQWQPNAPNYGGSPQGLGPPVPKH